MSNILPKKSWHVYNEENRKRVKRDEQVVEKAFQKDQERTNKAERQWRIEELRKKARIGSNEEGLNKMIIDKEGSKDIKPLKRVNRGATNDNDSDNNAKSTSSDKLVDKPLTWKAELAKSSRPWYNVAKQDSKTFEKLKRSTPLEREDPIVLFKSRNSGSSSSHSKYQGKVNKRL